MAIVDMKTVPEQHFASGSTRADLSRVFIAPVDGLSGTGLLRMADVAIVFVIDDDASIREALSSLIRSVGLGVMLFASAAEFLSFRRPDVPCCLVLDVRLPGLSGLDLQQVLRFSEDTLPVIFITGHGDIPMTVRAMKAGAVEFLLKPFREQELLDAIRLALSRYTELRTQRDELENTRRAVNVLTARERQVMDGLLAGRLNKQVAANLGISEVTVKLHRRRLMTKMSVSSLVELGRRIERLRAATAIRNPFG
jgi:FixJ family two-component response regulator